MRLRTTRYALPATAGGDGGDGDAAEGGARSIATVVAHPVVNALAEAAGVRDGDHRPVPAIGEHSDAIRREFA